MITEILDYLNEAPNNYTTSTRIKRKIEDIGRKETTNAVDYGRRLSFMKLLGLVRKKDNKSSWKITNKGKRWIKGELDPREL